MKKIVLFLIVVLIGNILLFQSCKKEDVNNINDTTLNYESFLKNYYNTTYSFGKSEIIFDNKSKYLVKEILLNNGTD